VAVAVEGQTLGQRIRRLREARAMSLAQVAGADFSRSFLNQVEMGRSQPSTRVLRVIAARLGTPVEYLLAGSSPAADAEVALERARISLARGEPARALRNLRPALPTTDWPAVADVSLVRAAALLQLDRDQEAAPVLDRAEEIIRARTDAFRLRRLLSLRRRRRLRVAGSTSPRAVADAYAAAGEKLLRRGEPWAALEHLRTARVLLEECGAANSTGAGAPATTTPTRTYKAAAGRRSEA
jgi:transcriptional regulator with XRE-family HTH domain